MFAIHVTRATSVLQCDYGRAYTYADGTWDFSAFSRHLLDQHWIAKVDDDDKSVTTMEATELPPPRARDAWWMLC